LSHTAEPLADRPFDGQVIGPALGHQPAAHVVLAVSFQYQALGFLGRSLDDLLKFLGADTLTVIIQAFDSQDLWGSCNLLF
jgi:hypothetical protein